MPAVPARTRRLPARRLVTGIAVVVLVGIANVRSEAQPSTTTTHGTCKTGKMWTKGFADGGALRVGIPRARGCRRTPSRRIRTGACRRFVHTELAGGETMDLFDRYNLIPYCDRMPFEVGGTVWTPPRISERRERNHLRYRGASYVPLAKTPATRVAGS